MKHFAFPAFMVGIDTKRSFRAFMTKIGHNRGYLPNYYYHGTAGVEPPSTSEVEDSIPIIVEYLCDDPDCFMCLFSYI